MPSAQPAGGIAPPRPSFGSVSAAQASQAVIGSRSPYSWADRVLRMARMSGDADDLPVGTEPTSEVLAASGITVTASGKARWREALSQPIPVTALLEGRLMRERAKARARGEAA